MNRRPNQSRSPYDAFTPGRTTRFHAATPDADFFETPQKRSPLFRTLRLVALILIAIFAINALVNQFVFVSRITVPVRGLNAEFDGYTLLHISDLKGAHFGGKQGLIRFALNNKAFDAVAMTGDMLSDHGNAQPLYALIEQLRELNSDAPIYMISGDSDPAPTSEAYFSSGSPFAPWVLGAKQRGAQLLSAPVAIEGKEQTIWLIPSALHSLDIDTMQGQFEQQYLRALQAGDDNATELGAYNLNWLEQTRIAREARQKDDVSVTLAHTPPTPEDTWTQDTQLILCGHYLGGLIRLPLLGPLFIPSRDLPRYGVLPGSDTHTGLRRESGTRIYTSPGLGAGSKEYPGMFFRLFNPPTVTLVTLTPSAL